jgi:hypothetical protein
MAKEDEPFHDGFLDSRLLSKWEFVPDAHGALRVWRNPSPNRKYVIFGDVSEGLEHGDWSNAYVIDSESLDVMARIRGKIDVGEYGDLLMSTGEWYSCGDGLDRVPAYLAIECNSLGLAVTKHCLDNGYRNLYYQHNLMTGEVLERIGWLTSAGVGGSRGLMLGKLQREYRMGRFKPKDRTALEEMALFAHRGPRGKPQSPPGKCDDCVMSMAGALFIATYESPVEIQKEEEKTGMASEIQKDYERMIKQSSLLNRGVIELGG